ncbi:type I restriction endonuclease subunit R [Bacteroides thetaiotaomicron]|uniref:type I restriction endonuclease subunit R n=1 Tax=Bacteroides thetaiotaomicron TaxID=818 RepID=UPI001CE23346|nr:HsdR family type I site-specific deoxyribonuclease [Bacteroides thetaiotaomicron]MCA6032398.1 type I restriction endonuclease subunit R [Bacteroides thetaiotaomicron]
MTTFDNELKFEMALIELLYTKYGWESEVLVNPTEAELLQNWAEILFTNNRSVDRLGEYPLTEGEMQQIVEQINTLRTPLKLNGFINGKTVSIKRDNPADTLHFGKEVSLKIYDRHEIAAGQSRYQIVRQPKFPTTSHMISDRRGDLMLLINGMPLIHIELKKSGIPVSQACNQIEKYSHGGIFSQGLFSLVQIFVAMNPEETLYFANPGVDGKFNKDYYFNWADFNNEPINEWNRVAASLLSIPMAHQLIGFYTVADDTDGVLKVMRSYQYQAVSAISDKVAKTKWADKEIYGGYVWHTTGSGKTMTSFKAAQLIANSKDADKVVFLMDRIELGTQSLLEYRGFADDSDSVQATENTDVLIAKLKDSDPNKTLIVTSIQKMSNIEEDGSKNDHDIALINKKRIVFIIDEAHRSTFGDMLTTIKKTFPAAIFFGFTGTPIHDENQKKKNTTSDIFGNELHRYSIADGIRDKNVLGFDPYKVLTYKDRDLRRVVALEKAKAATEEEAIADDKKREIYYRYMNDVPMAGHKDALGNYIKGIEDFIPTSQYEIPKHQHTVTNDIIDNWNTLSHGGKFHAIFATSSIPEAVIYYKLLKAEKPDLKIAALFDQSIDNNGSGIFKEDALIEMLTDYNKVYKQDFTIPTYAKYKKDVAARLAHKRPYLGIDRTPEKQLDLLIVVDQMLTGFDSKWVNTLYMDKLLKYEGLIQAFSRTNRLFGPEKPFGTIRYYRKPHTMHRNIENAFKLYSGDKPLGLFAEKLERNLERMNTIYQDIRELFSAAEVSNFEKLPKEDAERARFAKLFKEFNDYLEAAKIQGFQWDKLVYEFKNDDGKKKIRLLLDENTYLILALRYKELFGGGSGGGTGGGDIPYDIDSYLTEINTGKIDVDYMNSRFDKYLKLLQSDESTEDAKDKALAELHKTFAMLSQEEQKYANIFLHDVQRGDVMIEEGKSLRDYITEYQENAKNDQIRKFANAIGIDESKLRAFMNLHLSEENINEFGRFDELKESIDRNKAKEYFEKLESTIVPLRKVQIKIDSTLRRFVLEGGFDVE